MSSDDSRAVTAFRLITGFCEDMVSGFPKTNKKPTKNMAFFALYDNADLDNINEGTRKLINKYVLGFHGFLSEYNNLILSAGGLQEIPYGAKIHYSDRITCPIGQYISRADEEMKGLILDHLLAIGAVITKDQSFFDAMAANDHIKSSQEMAVAPSPGMKGVPPPSEALNLNDGSAEGAFLANMMDASVMGGGDNPLGEGFASMMPMFASMFASAENGGGNPFAAFAQMFSGMADGNEDGEGEEIPEELQALLGGEDSPFGAFGSMMGEMMGDGDGIDPEKLMRVMANSLNSLADSMKEDNSQENSEPPEEEDE